MRAISADEMSSCVRFFAEWVAEGDELMQAEYDLVQDYLSHLVNVASNGNGIVKTLPGLQEFQTRLEASRVQEQRHSILLEFLLWLHGIHFESIV